MHVLALDTTTPAGSVAIVADDRVLVEQRGDVSRSHAERLPEAVLTALAATGLTVADVDLFAVASGPGSFTGLRIGIATIQGLAVVHGRRVVPVSALCALAHVGSTALGDGAIVGAWMDARRRDVFSALYRVRHAEVFAVDRLTELDPPAVGTPASTLSRWCETYGLPSHVVGDGAVMYADDLAGRALVVPPPPLASVIARIAVARARRADTVDPAGVQPLYVRRPDAELARDSQAR
jgi:tRNA threonylcarbamoyladenosine biosynthesis protein TsaB